MVPSETQGALSSSQTTEFAFSALSAFTVSDVLDCSFSLQASKLPQLRLRSTSMLAFKRSASSMSKNSPSTKLVVTDVFDCSFSLQASKLPQLRPHSTSMLAFKRSSSSMSIAKNSSSTKLLASFSTSIINRECNSVA